MKSHENLTYVDPSRQYNHGCTAYAVYQDRGDGTAICIEAQSCNQCWQVGHDDRFVYAQVGDVISMENLKNRTQDTTKE